MEYNDCLLDSFSSSITKYCNEVLLHENSVSSTFRKYSVKNEEDIEFSFHLKTLSDFSCSRKLINQSIKSSCLTKEDFDRLKESSEEWALHIADVFIRESKLCLKLNKAHTFSVVLNEILTKKSNYGRGLREKQKVKLSSDVESASNLTEKRVLLLKAIAGNLLDHQGYLVNDDSALEIHFNIKNKLNINGVIYILCGPVINSSTGKKETQITPEDYLKLRKDGIRVMSEHKYWEVGNEEALDDLAEASIKICLMQVKPSHTISLDFLKGAESTSKGASFILYNCARIIAIRNKFQEYCKTGFYSSLPTISEIDFTSLTDTSEWCLLFNYLLEYPVLLRKTAEELVAGKANLHQICIFLTRLCSDFSVYYRRVRILRENRDHLLPMMYARLQLLFAIEQIFENAFLILGIKKIEYM